jgi:hypothetical protein
MSQVFSFRLDEKNPREAQAIQVIEVWASKGYSLRYVLVDALIDYAGNNKTQQEDFSLALGKILTLLQEIRVETEPGNRPHSREKCLSEPFLSAIAKATRPGLRAD